MTGGPAAGGWRDRSGSRVFPHLRGLNEALGGARGVASGMVTHVPARDQPLGAPVSPGTSLLAPGRSVREWRVPLQACPPPEEVLSCLFSQDAPLGSQPLSTDLAVTSSFSSPRRPQLDSVLTPYPCLFPKLSQSM